MKRRGWVIALGASALGFLGLQCVRPELPNPPVTADLVAPAAVKQILKNSCYDCHSNETQLPWFDRVVPAYWLVVHDVKEGRAALNFSDISRLPPPKQRAILFEAVNEIRLGAMPPKKYTRIHPHAGVTAAQLVTLEGYLSAGVSAPVASDEQRAVAAAQRAAWKTGPASRAVPPAPNGMTFLSDYLNWRELSSTDRFDNQTLRIILGNEVAQHALEAGQTHPWPKGSAFAKISLEALHGADGAVEPGQFKQVEFMLKDAEKYAATGGWGFARWLGPQHEPYGKSPDFARECIGCHRPMEADDFVYTIARLPPKAPSHASAPSDEPSSQEVAASAFAWPVLTISLDDRARTMSTLFGSPPAVDAARGPREGYPASSVLVLVTWSQRDDPHWFGARIPQSVQSVELLVAGAAPDEGHYQRFEGDALTPVASPANAAERIAFIRGRAPAVLP